MAVDDLLADFGIHGRQGGELRQGDVKDCKLTNAENGDAASFEAMRRDRRNEEIPENWRERSWIKQMLAT